MPAATLISSHYWEWRDYRIHYVRAGTPTPKWPPLLCVHGFGASTDHWRKNIEQLSETYEVWALDLLGFGRSQKADTAYSGDLWRDQLHDFIQEMICRPAVLLGNSLGGYASLCTAAQRSQSAAGVILLNSAGPFTSTEPEPPKRPVREAIGKLTRNVLLQPVPSYLLFQYVRRKSIIRKTLAKVYVDQSAITDRLIDEIYRPSCDPGAATVFRSVFQTRQGAKVDELLQQLDRPLMLLWGEGDPWMNARARSAQFRQYYSQLTEHFLNAGHCPHDEVPEQVNALVDGWVQEFCVPVAC
ncbi:MAG: alpha/beta fold hydrolase [Cyanobacteria bacterium J06597_1]